MTWTWSPTYEHLSDLFFLATSLLTSEKFKFRVLNSNVTHSCYATLRFLKYLKSEIHLRNAQIINSVNKGIIKTCLVVDMVRKDWSESLLLVVGFITGLFLKKYVLRGRLEVS